MFSFQYMANIKQKQTMLLWIMVLNAMREYLHCNMPFSNKDKALMKNLYQFK